MDHLGTCRIGQITGLHLDCPGLLFPSTAYRLVSSIPSSPNYIRLIDRATRERYLQQLAWSKVLDGRGSSSYPRAYHDALPRPRSSLPKLMRAIVRITQDLGYYRMA